MHAIEVVLGSAYQKVFTSAIYFWMNHVYSSTVCAFVKISGLNDSFTKVSLSFDWRILSRYEDERICDKNDTFSTPFYECVFYHEPSSPLHCLR